MKFYKINKYDPLIYDSENSDTCSENQDSVDQHILDEEIDKICFDFLEYCSSRIDVPVKPYNFARELSDSLFN